MSRSLQSPPCNTLSHCPAASGNNPATCSLLSKPAPRESTECDADQTHTEVYRLFSLLPAGVARTTCGGLFDGLYSSLGASFSLQKPEMSPIEIALPVILDTRGRVFCSACEIETLGPRAPSMIQLLHMVTFSPACQRWREIKDAVVDVLKISNICGRADTQSSAIVVHGEI